jgi:allantoicase
MSDFRELIDLASERLGGSVLYATDDFFAEKENLLKAAPPLWKEHEYTDRGKWMDGWESRRKRTPGHDFVIVRLGVPGTIRGLVVDTSFFRGNYPEQCSFEGTWARSDADVETLLAADWIEILPQSLLAGDRQNLFGVAVGRAFTHLRFHIYPDGGVARLRVHGEVFPDWLRVGGLKNEVDLAAAENGADVLECSDMFFGPKHNLIMPGRAPNMSDGWETKRRRGPGHDWVIVRLAAEGVVRRIEIGTNHFKGNYPDTASIEARTADSEEWVELLPRTKLQAHTRHFFAAELNPAGPVTHLRLNVYPDGGVSRLRVHGTATDRAVGQQVVRRINALPFVERELLACCGSREWARQVAAARPFESWETLLEASDRIWRSLSPDDWIEAFRAHPRIGERSRGWSAQEQAGVSGDFASLNEEYEKRFGHIFIVCASGKSSEDIAAALRQRMSNTPESELPVAAEEQRQITHLRLRKLVTG